METQLSYAIGVANPVSILVETFGTGKLLNDELTELVKSNFDLRPAAIIEQFKLKEMPKQRNGRFYREVAAYGHFGRSDLDLPWEDVTKKSIELSKLI